MKIGLCTGGGDCPGLNAVIRAVVKHAVGSYGFEVYGIKDSFNGLMSEKLDIRKLELSDVSLILNRGGTILGTTNKGNPFALEKSDGHKINLSDVVVKNYKKAGLDAIIVVGGDGTQTIAAQLAGKGINIVGVPKTIDNDLMATDETVGFNTAVEVASDAVERLTSTAESHDRIMVLEVMGRDAGYIALHSGIAGGANAILIPEIPFSYESIVHKINVRKAAGRFFSVVVVAEGAYEKNQDKVYAETKTSAHRPLNLGGIGSQVAEKLHEMTGFDSRITVLGHVQRGGRPTPYDRVLGSAFGVHAVELVKKKRYSKLVSYRDGKFVEIDYSVVAGKSKPLELDSPYIKTAEGLGICLGRELAFDMKTAPE